MELLFCKFQLSSVMLVSSTTLVGQQQLIPVPLLTEIRLALATALKDVTVQMDPCLKVNEKLQFNPYHATKFTEIM